MNIIKKIKQRLAINKMLKPLSLAAAYANLVMDPTDLSTTNWVPSNIKTSNFDTLEIGRHVDLHKANATYDFLKVYPWNGKLSIYQKLVGFEYEIKNSRMTKKKPIYEESK